jgi:hypothetical protein
VHISTNVVSSNPAQARCNWCKKLCDKVCQWVTAGLWFSRSTLVSSTNKADHHDITKILLNVALNTMNQPFQCDNDDDVHFVLDKNMLSWIFIVLAGWNNSPHVEMLIHTDTCWSTLTHYTDPLWHMLIHSDTFWFTLTHVDPLWHIILIHSDTLYWSTLTHYTDSLWHMLIHSDTWYWFTLTHFDPFWHMLIHSDTCRSILTHYTDSLWHMLIHSDTLYWFTLTHYTDPLWHMMLIHYDTCWSTLTH